MNINKIKKNNLKIITDKLFVLLVINISLLFFIFCISRTPQVNDI